MPRRIVAAPPSALVTILVACLAVSGCWVSEDHTRRVAEFVRDSVVIDSVAQTVSTDSLYVLNHGLLRATDAQQQFQLIQCERARLQIRHGLWAVRMAELRMLDTLWRDVHPDSVDAMRARWPAAIATAARPASCGIPDGARPPNLPSRDIFNRPSWW